LKKGVNEGIKKPPVQVVTGGNVNLAPLTTLNLNQFIADLKLIYDLKPIIKDLDNKGKEAELHK